MKIRTKIRAAIILCLIMIMATGTVLHVSTEKRDAENQKAGIMIDMVKDTVALKIVTHEYLLHPGERSLRQWHYVYQALTERLSQASGLFQLSREKEALGRISDNLNRFKTIFHGLGVRSKTACEKPPVSAELRDRLIGELLIKSQMAVSPVFQLQKDSQTKLAAVQQRTTFMIALLFLILLSLILAILLWLSRGVGKPVATLREGMKIIGGGDLDHRIPLTGKDEMGELAKAFNEMAARRLLDENKVRKQGAILEGMNRVLREALTCENEEDVARTCLEVAEALSGARFGFIGEINHQGKFNTIAISDPGWEACKMLGTDAVRAVTDMPIRGIDRSAMVKGKSRIVNDPENHPDRVGTPEGHPPITSFLGVPLKQGEKTMGMIALANKASGFDPADREAVEALSIVFLEAIGNKRTEMELAEHRNRLEQLVEERTAELEQSNRELEQFAYVASHDLQEPLRKVQAFGDRLKINYSDAMDDRGRDYIERMQGATARMRSMIDALLSLSRIQTRKEPFAPVDLAIAARDAVMDLDILIEQTGGRVEIGDLPTVNGDISQMRQLLANLVGNALKFRHEDMAPVVTIQSEPMGEKGMGAGQCRIIVADNGIGFDEKFAERIFQPFERLHGRSTYEGTGIGLSICKRIVVRHGGSITVKSEIGRGTRFIITLPGRIGEEPLTNDGMGENNE